MNATKIIRLNTETHIEFLRARAILRAYDAHEVRYTVDFQARHGAGAEFVAARRLELAAAEGAAAAAGALFALREAEHDRAVAS